MPVEELKEQFYDSILAIVKKTIDVIADKARPLMNTAGLTKQQLVMRGLMIKYIEV